MNITYTQNGDYLMLTARIIEKIIVKSRQDLEIIFIGGYTQQISLQ